MELDERTRPHSAWRRKAWAFALVYTAMSLFCEIILIVVFRLKVPQNNAMIAPIILTVPPLAASLACGYRWPGQAIRLAVLTSVLTLIFTLIAGKITGIFTGLGLPIIVRTLAGFVSALIVNRASRQG